MLIQTCMTHVLDHASHGWCVDSIRLFFRWATGLQSGFKIVFSLFLTSNWAIISFNHRLINKRVISCSSSTHSSVLLICVCERICVIFILHLIKHDTASQIQHARLYTVRPLFTSRTQSTPSPMINCRSNTDLWNHPFNWQLILVATGRMRKLWFWIIINIFIKGICEHLWPLKKMNK